jgi:hypothetical protein
VAFPVLAVSYLVAEVLLASAGYKAFRPRGYWQAVGSYQLLRGLPRRLRLLLAGAVPAGELASAALIVVPGTRSVGLGAACAAFVLFYALVGGDNRPVIAHCGCWGQTVLGVPRRALLARNLLLVAMSAGTLAAAQALGPGTRHGGPVSLALVAAGLVVPFAFLLLELPQLVMIATLRRGGPSPRGTVARPGTQARDSAAPVR